MKLPEFPPAFWSTLFALIVSVAVYFSEDAAAVYELFDNAAVIATNIASLLLILARLWQEYKRDYGVRGVGDSLLKRWFWG